MGKIILKTTIKRQKDRLYYCGTDEKGNITICETETKRKKKSKKL